MRTQAKPRVLPAECESLLCRTDVASALRISIRKLSLMVAVGTFPKADLMVGSSPRWRLKTFNLWVESQSGV